MHVDDFRSYLAGALDHASDFNENINTKSNEFRTLLENLTQQRVNVKRVTRIYKKFLKKVEGERVKPAEVSLLEFAGYRIPVFNPLKKLVEPAVILGYTGSRSGSLMTTVLPIKKVEIFTSFGPILSKYRNSRVPIFRESKNTVEYWEFLRPSRTRSNIVYMISPKGQESELDRDLFLKRCTVGHNLVANNLVDERGLLVSGCYVVDENELRKFFYLGFTILLAAHMTDLTTKNIKNQLNTITKLIEKEVTSELPDVVANFHAALTELDNLSDEEREELEEERLPKTEAEVLAEILRIFTTKLRIVIPILLQRTKDVCRIMRETLKRPSEYSTAVFDCETDKPVKLSLDYSEKLISLLEQITELCEEYNKEVVHFVDTFKNYV